MSNYARIFPLVLDVRLFSRIRGILLLLLLLLSFSSVYAADADSSLLNKNKPKKPQFDWHTDLQYGYGIGENGKGFPSIKSPLENNAEAGFYIGQIRLESEIQFDSSLMGMAQFELYSRDIREAFLQKNWDRWSIEMGLFRGVGVHSGVDIDDFDRITLQPTQYVKWWGSKLQRQYYRDLGIQFQRSLLKDRSMRLRWFIHNGSGRRLDFDQPSWNDGNSPSQILAGDMGLDWNFSPFSSFGAHVGVKAGKEWEEFVGRHGWWNLPYWLKVNQYVVGSAYHEFHFPGLEIQHEFFAMQNRFESTPPDGHPQMSWGLSSLAQFEITPDYFAYARYEFFDPSDGLYSSDRLHAITVGGKVKRFPFGLQNSTVTLELYRFLEQGLKETYPNDEILLQAQMQF